MLHPLGGKAAVHTVKQTARDRPLQTILHVAVIMTTSITLVLYTSFWLLFRPKNTLGLLLVGHLLWQGKSSGPSLKLSCKGLHSFGLCKCCFSRVTEQSAFCQLLPQQVIYPWVSWGRLFSALPDFWGIPSLPIQGYWYLLKEYGVLNCSLGTVKKSAFFQSRQQCWDEAPESLLQTTSLLVIPLGTSPPRICAERICCLIAGVRTVSFQPSALFLPCC